MTPNTSIILALMLAQGSGGVLKLLPVKFKRYGDSGVASAFIKERQLRQCDEVHAALGVPEVQPDEEYTGLLEGLEELLPGSGQAFVLEDEGSPDVICPNCHNALFGTCSVCAPVKADGQVRLIPGYTMLKRKYEREHVTPEQFAIA